LTLKKSKVLEDVRPVRRQAGIFQLEFTKTVAPGRHQSPNKQDV